MLLTTLTINEPMNNVFEPGQSILPERLRSITIPTLFPILADDLNSVTEPLIIERIEEYDIPLEFTEEY